MYIVDRITKWFADVFGGAKSPRTPTQRIVTTTVDDLQAILFQHERWLDRKGGQRADLSRAKLSGANLSGADLRHADLYHAELSSADLSGADLTEADLVGADLSHADLTGADLSHTKLYRANLRGAKLNDVKMNWVSHNLIAERLRQAAGDDGQRRSLAGLIAASPDWCWEEYSALDIPAELREWAFGTIRAWARDEQEKDEEYCLARTEAMRRLARLERALEEPREPSSEPFAPEGGAWVPVQWQD